MHVRTPDEALLADVVRAYERLVVHETFEGNTHLADVSLPDVVDEFWPGNDGWRIISVEPNFFFVFFLMEHPSRGIAACIIGSVEPGAGIGVAEAWARLSVEMRARNIWASHHSHGPTRLDLLDEFVSANASGGLGSLDEAMLNCLLNSPTFMDETTRAMVALNDAYGLLAEKAGYARTRAERAVLDAAAER